MAHGRVPVLKVSITAGSHDCGAKREASEKQRFGDHNTLCSPKGGVNLIAPLSTARSRYLFSAARVVRAWVRGGAGAVDWRGVVVRGCVWLPPGADVSGFSIFGLRYPCGLSLLCYHHALFDTCTPAQTTRRGMASTLPLFYISYTCFLYDDIEWEGGHERAHSSNFVAASAPPASTVDRA